MLQILIIKTVLFHCCTLGTFEERQKAEIVFNSVMGGVYLVRMCGDTYFFFP